eukprot:m.1490938 g.1490938  ORF g.1490938 m.1490938 type:complete len:1654 (-) comp25191_c0_seq34:3132-8093(-)
MGEDTAMTDVRIQRNASDNELSRAQRNASEEQEEFLSWNAMAQTSATQRAVDPVWATDNTLGRSWWHTVWDALFRGTAAAHWQLHHMDVHTPSAVSRRKRGLAHKLQSRLPEFEIIFMTAVYCVSVLVYIVIDYGAESLANPESSIPLKRLWTQERDNRLHIVQICLCSIALFHTTSHYMALFTVPQTISTGQLQRVVVLKKLLTDLPGLLNVALFVIVILPLTHTEFDNLWAPTFLHIWGARKTFIHILHMEMFRKNRDDYVVIIAQHAFQLASMLLSVVFTMVFIVERSGIDSIYREEPRLYDALWFVMTTLSTVGYGDTVPSNWVGQLVVMVMMTMILVTLPEMLPALGAAMQNYRNVGQRFTPLFGQDHVVIIAGTHLAAEDIRSFLVDLFASTTSHPVAVFLSPVPKSDDVRSVFNSPKYKGRLHYLVGTALKEDDLARASTRTASAVFIIADTLGPNASRAAAEASDSHTILRSWAVLSHTDQVVQYVQFHLPENKGHLLGLPNVMPCCLGELRFSVIAKSLLIKGFSTLMQQIMSGVHHRRHEDLLTHEYDHLTTEMETLNQKKDSDTATLSISEKKRLAWLTARVEDLTLNFNYARSCGNACHRVCIGKSRNFKMYHNRSFGDAAFHAVARGFVLIGVKVGCVCVNNDSESTGVHTDSPRNCIKTARTGGYKNTVVYSCDNVVLYPGRDFVLHRCDTLLYLSPAPEKYAVGFTRHAPTADDSVTVVSNNPGVSNPVTASECLPDVFLRPPATPPVARDTRDHTKTHIARSKSQGSSLHRRGSLLRVAMMRDTSGGDAGALHPLRQRAVQHSNTNVLRIRQEFIRSFAAKLDVEGTSVAPTHRSRWRRAAAVAIATSSTSEEYDDDDDEELPSTRQPRPPAATGDSADVAGTGNATTSTKKGDKRRQGIAFVAGSTRAETATSDTLTARDIRSAVVRTLERHAMFFESPSIKCFMRPPTSDARDVSAYVQLVEPIPIAVTRSASAMPMRTEVLPSRRASQVRRLHPGVDPDNLDTDADDDSDDQRGACAEDSAEMDMDVTEDDDFGKKNELAGACVAAPFLAADFNSADGTHLLPTDATTRTMSLPTALPNTASIQHTISHANLIGDGIKYDFVDDNVHVGPDLNLIPRKGMDGMVSNMIIDMSHGGKRGVKHNHITQLIRHFREAKNVDSDRGEPMFPIIFLLPTRPSRNLQLFLLRFPAVWYCVDEILHVRSHNLRIAVDQADTILIVKAVRHGGKSSELNQDFQDHHLTGEMDTIVDSQVITTANRLRRAYTHVHIITELNHGCNFRFLRDTEPLRDQNSCKQYPEYIFSAGCQNATVMTDTMGNQLMYKLYNQYLTAKINTESPHKSSDKSSLKLPVEHPEESVDFMTLLYQLLGLEENILHTSGTLKCIKMDRALVAELQAAGIAEVREHDTPYFDYNDVLRVLLDTRGALVIGMYQEPRLTMTSQPEAEQPFKNPIHVFIRNANPDLERYEAFSCLTKGAVLLNPSIETKVAPGDSLYLLAAAVGSSHAPHTRNHPWQPHSVAGWVQNHRVQMGAFVPLFFTSTCLNRVYTCLCGNVAHSACAVVTHCMYAQTHVSVRPRVYCLHVSVRMWMCGAHCTRIHVCACVYVCLCLHVWLDVNAWVSLCVAQCTCMRVSMCGSL